MGPEKSGPIPIVGKERSSIKRPGICIPGLLFQGSESFLILRRFSRRGRFYTEDICGGWPCRLGYGVPAC